MKKSVLLIGLSVLLILAFALSACQPAATPAVTEPTDVPVVEPTAEQVGGFQIPAVQEGKFNVAMVLIGPHDDGGWSQAHYEGLEYVARERPQRHIPPTSRTCRKAPTQSRFSAALSRKGFNLIFGTSFGFMDPMETVAGEFPDIMYIHICGYQIQQQPTSATCSAPWKT